MQNLSRSKSSLKFSRPLHIEIVIPDTSVQPSQLFNSLTAPFTSLLNLKSQNTNSQLRLQTEIVFGRTLVQTHFFRRNCQKPTVADAGTRHFANCFLMAQSAILWSLKAPQQKFICVVENNWFPIFLGAGNGTGTMSFCGAFFVMNTGDYWIMICVPIFVKGRERYFETDIYLISSSCSSN